MCRMGDIFSKHIMYCNRNLTTYFMFLDVRYLGQRPKVQRLDIARRELHMVHLCLSCPENTTWEIFSHVECTTQNVHHSQLPRLIATHL